MRRGDEPPTPFVLAYRAIEANDRDRLVDLVDRFPDLVVQRGTNGKDLFGMAGDPSIVSFLIERGAASGDIARWRNCSAGSPATCASPRASATSS